MEQFLTFPNIVLLSIFITILFLIIGYSIYTWVNDDELEAFDKFDKEYREGLVSQPQRRIPVRSLGETETRIVPSSIHSRSPAQRQVLQDLLQRDPLSTSEYEVRRQQLLESLSNDDIDGDILGHLKSIAISPEPPPVSDYEGDQINPGVYVPRDPDLTRKPEDKT
jgi:hypothetical protein